MKALFVHDHIFYTDNKYFYSDKLPYKTWLRYLKNFDELVVFGRAKLDIDKSKQVPLSSGEKVKFIIGQSLNSIKSLTLYKNKEKKRLEELILNSDIVIARNSMYGNMAIKIARKLNKPYVLEIVACPFNSLWNHGSLKGRLVALIAMYNLKNIALSSKYIHYVSQSFLQKSYPPSSNAIVEKISNVEIPKVENEVLENRLDKIKQKKTKIVFGIIGSFKTKNKGIHTAIEAFAKLNRKVENFSFELRVLGTGDIEYYEDYAQKFKIKDKVFFDGIRSSGKEVFDWLDDIDIYLQPSLAEGVPRALIEAMSRACPAIASSTCGIPELLDNNELFAPGNHNELSIIIEKVYLDNLWFEKQANRNFEKSKDYTKEKLDNKRFEFYERIKKDILQ